MAQSQLDDDDDLGIRSSTFVDLQALAKCVANAVRDVELLLTSAETYRKLYGQIPVGAEDKVDFSFRRKAVLFDQYHILYDKILYDLNILYYVCIEKKVLEYFCFKKMFVIQIL